MRKRRVVVTGIGLITPCGTGADATWGALTRGESGIGPITTFDAASLPSRIAGEVLDFDPLNFMDRKLARRLERFQQFALAASEMAMADAAFTPTADDLERTAVVVGSAVGGLAMAQREYDKARTDGPGAISPFFILQLLPNMAPAHIAIRFGFRGVNLATNSACATGAHAVGEAMRLIERGGADAALAGGAEAPICLMGVGGFAALRALSTRNDDPTAASRPFDRDRDGFVLAEGAAILLLEELEHAERRGARIRGELVGYGTTGDAHHITVPAPEHIGAQACMRAALADAGATPDEVEYINAHATSTPVGDGEELFAIERVFGERTPSIPISSTKSMTGHMTGAAGAAETAFTVLALESGVVPPTLNLDSLDYERELDCVPKVARVASPALAMNNSFGFGGTNASLVIRRYEGR